MSIFLTKDSRVIVQGITGGEGSKHTALMLKAGTQVVGGVNARKAGTTVEHGDVTRLDVIEGVNDDFLQLLDVQASCLQIELMSFNIVQNRRGQQAHGIIIGYPAGTALCQPLAQGRG